MKHFLRLSALPAWALAAAAQAVIVITPGPGGFDTDENVLFNEPGMLNVGPMVQGVTNQSGFVVNFFGAGEDLHTPAGGQARIEAVDGAFQGLTAQMDNPNVLIKTLVWNLNADQDGTVTFRVGRSGGADHIASFSVDRAGENFFRFEAIGEYITFVRLDTDVPLSDIRQVRLTPVPEPATMLGLAMAIGAVGLKRSRRKAG